MRGYSVFGLAGMLVVGARAVGPSYGPPHQYGGSPYGGAPPPPAYDLPSAWNPAPTYVGSTGPSFTSAPRTGTQTPSLSPTGFSNTTSSVPHTTTITEDITFTVTVLPTLHTPPSYNWTSLFPTGGTGTGTPFLPGTGTSPPIGTGTPLLPGTGTGTNPPPPNSTSPTFTNSTSSTTTIQTTTFITLTAPTTPIASLTISSRPRTGNFSTGTAPPPTGTAPTTSTVLTIGTASVHPLSSSNSTTGFQTVTTTTVPVGTNTPFAYPVSTVYGWTGPKSYSAYGGGGAVATRKGGWFGW